MQKLLFTLLLFIQMPLAIQAKEVLPPAILIQNYNVDDYNASCQNMALSVSNNGLLCVANNSGLLIFDGNTWQLNELPDKSGLTGVTYFDHKIFTRTENNQFGYWVADSLGLYTYHLTTDLPETVDFDYRPEPYHIPDEIRKSTPTAYATIGRLHLTGTENNGLYLTNQKGDILLHLHHLNQLPDNHVRAICVQDEKLVWIAFDNGLAQIAIDPPIQLLDERSAIGKLEQAILQDSTIYIQTNRGYFKRLLNLGGRFESIGNQEGLSILGNKDASEENLSPNTLFQNPDALGVFAQATSTYAAPNNLYWLTRQNEAALFMRENGMGAIKCRILFDNYDMNLITRGKAIFPLNADLHLVSAMQGTLLVNVPQLIKQSIGNVPIGFSQIRYSSGDGQVHHLPLTSEKIVLPHHFSEMSISVGTSVFTQNHQISYRIEGVSTNWSDWQEGGNISFMQLPEGEYTLKVRKYVVRGPFLELSLPIQVRPAWYNSIWAYVVYVLLIWVMIQSGLRHYLRSLRKEEQEEREAQLQAEQQKNRLIKQELLEAELQNKNEELTLQTSALVKKNQAMQTLLEELDKQKESMGDRYPNKLYNRLRTLMEETLTDKESWTLFENYFNSAHRHFTEKLQQQFADLTVGDLRICCFLRMNLSTKEIASLLNLSVRAVEIRRYRLRKRLGLEGETNLVDFLMRF